MSKFNVKKVMPRYNIMAYLMLLLAMVIVGKALYLMTVKRDYWTKVADRVKRDSVSVHPTRGNILSCDGQLLASTLPKYNIFMDFKALHEAGNDSLWDAKLDSICMLLHRTFPEKTEKQFRILLAQGRKKQSRHWPIWKPRIDYKTFMTVSKFPVFCLSQNKSGFHFEEHVARENSFGDMAKRTLGAMYGAKDSARFGLELSYDSILRGQNGIVHRQKVLNRYLNITDTPPEDGADIVTTIDVNIQDLAERALLKELRTINDNGWGQAYTGVAIVMEVKTGDIKAIVNEEIDKDGNFHETRNHAVSDLMEPGSVFKPVSIMVALDDGVVDTTYRVDTKGGVYDMYGRDMKDHNWRHGGYGVLTLPQTLWYSSNIGVSRIIDDHYRKHPEKFVEGVYRTGIADPLGLPIKGAAAPKIRMPHVNKNGWWDNWSRTTLPWMSIGYETQIPPISTLTFYNAIANGGKMMRPRLVLRTVKDGKTITEYPTEVMRESICKEKTLKEIQTILEQVVSIGLGKKAGSPSFKVSGKTGTAQISRGSLGYKTGGVNYLLSFAGYFPSDNPQYSCIVCIQKSGLPASGGGMSGVVFHDIAEGIMAQSIKLDISHARDSSSVMVPDVKYGDILSANYVLQQLGITPNRNFMLTGPKQMPVWGRASIVGNTSVSLRKTPQYAHNRVPDVHGMGARDAVFQMESRGIRTSVIGRGTVTKQSLAPGTKIGKNARCLLVLN